MCSKSAKEPRRPEKGKEPEPALLAAVEPPSPASEADKKQRPAESSEHLVEQCVFPVEPELLELNIEATRLEIAVRHEQGEEAPARGGSSC